MSRVGNPQKPESEIDLDIFDTVIDKAEEDVREAILDKNLSEKSKREALDYQATINRLDIKSRSVDLNLREEFARKIFNTMAVWLFSVIVILILSGIESISIIKWNLDFRFKLNDSVLIAMLTSTSVQVIALVAIILNYLFPKNGSGKNDLAFKSHDCN